MPLLTAPEPLRLSGRRIFLTGATGFMGRTLLDYAVASAARHGADFEVCGLSRDPDSFVAKYPAYAKLGWLSLRQGDILALPAPDGPFTDVIHAAADTHSSASAREWMVQIVDGTHEALQFATRGGATRFLHTSSGAVYGLQPAGVAALDEDYRGAPPTNAASSVYGQAKRLAEQLCTAFWTERGLGAVNARCFAFVSPHLPLAGPYAMGNFIRDALFADEIVVKGDGRAVRSYLDGRDAAHWLFHLLSAGVPGEAYNVGSSRPLAMREVARIVAERVAPGKNVVVQSAVADSATRSVYVPSVAKSERLGLRETIDLESAITDAATAIVEAARRT